MPVGTPSPGPTIDCLAAGTTEHWDLCRSTALFLKRDGLEGFRRHRRRMLGLFAQSTNVTIAERIGKACLLAPLPGPDQDEGVRLALHTDMTPSTGTNPVEPPDQEPG